MIEFKDELINEYKLWKTANPDNFNWWSYVNMKSDLQTALGFAKFFYPEIIEIDNCFILKDRFSDEIYKQWKSNLESKTEIEKMMNLYEVKDFFHINRNEDENLEDQIATLGKVLQHFWSQSFKERYPLRKIKVDLFDEYGEKFITVYEETI